jgi:dipeptidyl aminopeptidase/acylaminoacyl peptidase
MSQRPIPRSLILVLPILAASVLPALGADREQFTPQVVAKIRAVTSAVISPDGSQVAYVLSVPRRPPVEDDGPAWAELHVVDKAGTSRPFITGEANVSDVAWTADGKSIAFLARRGKDEHKSLYMIPAQGGEARRVLAHGTDLSAYALAPDGRRVAFLATEPEAKPKEDLRKKGFSQVVFEEEFRPVKVWIGGLDPLGAKPKPLSLTGSASELRWSPAGPRLAVALAPTPSVDDSFMKRRLHVVDVDSGAIVGKVDNVGKLGKAAWSPDGKSLAFLSAADIHDPAVGRLMVVPAEGGTPRDLLPGYEGHVADLAWRDSGTIVFNGDEGTGTALWLVGLDGASRSSLPSGGVILTSVSLSSDGKSAAFLGQTPAHPAEAFVTIKGEGPRRLTNSNPWLGDLPLAPQETVKYKARDGLMLEGVLIRPLGVSEKTRVPLVLDVHGGPESHVRDGWITAYSMPGQLLAARGFAVFAPNYRGSTGRGVAFSKLSQGDPAGKEFDDLVDAVDHFVASGLADKAKVGITGGSYGGYATAWCSTRYTDRFAAGVMFVGISDVVSKTGTTDIPEEEFLVHARRRPWDDWNALLERSPIYHARNSKTPLLILHGRDDPRVFPGQSLELHRFLKTAGKAPVRLVFYPGEGHGNLRAASRLDYNLRMVQWLEHYLKGPGGPPPPVEIDYPKPEGDAPPKP